MHVMHTALQQFFKSFEVNSAAPCMIKVHRLYGCFAIVAVSLSNLDSTPALEVLRLSLNEQPFLTVQALGGFPRASCTGMQRRDDVRP
mmetsp:Transcript_27784/g.69800  ORF Transcript_27784/g.69800 Transcript_27784/m.69800 type:complete len:88 (+) Transcript_27784:1371-1634(+)